MPTEKRILARLFKTPSYQGSYRLRGRMLDGRVVEVYCNQRKSRRDDPDFFLVEVVESEEAKPASPHGTCHALSRPNSPCVARRPTPATPGAPSPFYATRRDVTAHGGPLRPVANGGEVQPR